MSPRGERDIDVVAAEWLELGDRMNHAQRVAFRAWLAGSELHVEAYLRACVIDVMLRQFRTDYLRQASVRADRGNWLRAWKKLRDHPLAIAIGAVMIAVIATWNVSNAVVVQPMKTRMDELAADIAAMKESAQRSPQQRPDTGTVREGAIAPLQSR